MTFPSNGDGVSVSSIAQGRYGEPSHQILVESYWWAYRGMKNWPTIYRQQIQNFIEMCFWVQ